MTENKKEFLLKEFDSIYKYSMNLSSIRVGTLGACLTILGLIFSFGNRHEFPSIIGVYTIMLVVVFACIRILAVFSRSIFIFGNHLKWIAKELGITSSFAEYWEEYVQKNSTNSKDSATYAFVIIARAINLAILIYVNIGIGTNIKDTQRITIQAIISVAISLISIIMYLWNESHIRKELNPKGFLRRITVELHQIKNSSLDKASHEKTDKNDLTDN